MAYVRIIWDKPETSDPWTIQKVERSITGEAGVFSEIASVATQSGNYVDQNGARTYFYRTRFYDPNTGVYDDYTNPIQGGDSVGYLTLEEARRQGKFTVSEFDDPTLQDYINQATLRVDEITGRTWQGIMTVSNQTYDGSGSNILQLPHTDLVAISALSVANGTSSPTVVTPSKLIVYPSGFVVLDTWQHADLEATEFPKGYKNIAISYTYGIDTPTDSIKELTFLLMVQKIRYDPAMQEMIDRKIQSLKYKGMQLV